MIIVAETKYQKASTQTKDADVRQHETDEIYLHKTHK